MRTKRLSAALLLLLSGVLPSCSPSDASEQVISLGGLWEVRNDIVEFDSPGLSESDKAELLRRAEAAFPPQRECRPPLTAASYPVPGHSFASSSLGDCTYRTVERPGALIDRTASCSGDRLRSDASTTGNIHRERYDMTITMLSIRPSGTRIVVRETGRLIGPCAN